MPLPQSLGGGDSVPVADGKYLFYPRSASVIQDVVTDFRFTRRRSWQSGCPDFDGSFWDPIGPGPISDGSGNPPPGFDNPYDNGTIQLLTHDRAEYQSRSGTVLRFNRNSSASRTSYYCS